jgi:diaminohydroxyphosphoribosylaminopyrimidine deaminase/5-amino-6-(5-phosphoribosylamino)uracil reductase
MPTDQAYMHHALALAEKTVGLASPNPQVGCVIVRDDIVLSEGAHFYDARDHAEIAALKQAAANRIGVRGATAYVTLEPCSHHGRTGPCADALIAAGIARCVVATVDPNPAVSGQGIARMRAAGIQVDIGVLEQRGRTLNNAFALSITRHRPFVTLKTALSVDGRIAPPPSARTPNAPFLLTGPKARADVQALRHASDAILFGIGTVLADDPLMTDRTGLPRRRPLMRVLLDTDLRVPMNSKLVESTATIPNPPDLWIFCDAEADRLKKHELRCKGAMVTEVSNDGGLEIPEILAHLHDAKLLNVLVEAGSAINGAFLRADLVDQAILYYAETELGPGSMPFAAGTAGPFALEEKMLSVAKRMVGPDVRVSGLLRDPWANAPVLD